jgi:hypothetical protein
MRVPTIAAILFAATLFTATLAPAIADTFSDLAKTGACFHRTYDEGRLRNNPRQQTTTMTLWIKGDAEEGRRGSGNIGLSVTRRGDSVPLFLSGGCEWGKDQSWMKTFRKKTGAAGCITSAVPDVFPDVSSAEEGGGIVLDPAADGRTLFVHLDDSQSMVRRADRARKISVRFGADDRVFLLVRADAQACAAVKDAVTTMEPRKPPR